MTNASQSVIKGQGFYRHKERVTTVGFGIPIDVSTSAIVVGPDSDYYEYAVVYFDPTTDFTAKLATVTPDRPFYGPMVAGEHISPSGLITEDSAGNPIAGQKARIMVVPTKIMDPSETGWVTALFTAIPPVADIIAYTSAPPPVVSLRADYEFHGKFSVGAGVTKRWLFPAYGRRSIQINLYGITGPQQGDWNVFAYGKNAKPTGGLDLGSTGAQYEIRAAASPSSSIVPVHYESTTGGTFDAVEVGITTVAQASDAAAGAGVTFQVKMSDRQGGA